MQLPDQLQPRELHAAHCGRHVCARAGMPSHQEAGHTPGGPYMVPAGVHICISPLRSMLPDHWTARALLRAFECGIIATWLWSLRRIRTAAAHEGTDLSAAFRYPVAPTQPYSPRDVHAPLLKAPTLVVRSHQVCLPPSMPGVPAVHERQHAAGAVPPAGAEQAEGAVLQALRRGG